MRLIISASMMLGVTLIATPALAQAPAIANPTPGCKATPAEIEQSRQAGIAFSRQGRPQPSAWRWPIPATSSTTRRS